ncbi:epoxide hydrolase family protein [Longispora albida]|uniref:epoxide hydrolase family protein n=1 Tax=Longispora albida TaxID=203523 RepID=UPI000360100B|nr:epoxide hydrolase family protein [Longispora albida]
MTEKMTEYTLDIPQADLDDLADRLERVRFTDEIPGADYGVGLDRLRRLVGRWRDGFDWRAVERRLNAYPQFTTEIDGQNIHFLHVRSPEPDALPLILTHGWPGSILEYERIIAPLTDPSSHGADPAQAFHVVIPSLPGFGPSGPTTEPGWGTARTARAWAELMARLGYERYGAAGNDAGSMIAPEIGRHDPERVAGVHVTQLFSFPSGDPAEMADLTEEEQAALGVLGWFWENKGAFNTLHSQQPQTLAHALADSPAGLLGWHLQLLDEDLDDEFVLANTALYWLTRTAGSAIRFYAENARAGHEQTGPTTVPTGLCAAASGDFQSIRRFAERDHSAITSWNVHAGVTGHYAAHTHTATVAEDLRAFYAKLR